MTGEREDICKEHENGNKDVTKSAYVNDIS